MGNLALSEDGSTLAVGLPESENDQKGSVYVYTELPDSPKCDEGLTLARVSFTVDDHPDGNSWALKDGAGNVKLEGGPYKSVPGFTTFVHETCLDMNDCFMLDVFAIDDWGKFGGGYSVFLDGELALSSGSNFFEMVDRHRLGNCSSPCAEGETLSRFLLQKRDEHDTGDLTPVGVEEHCTPSDDCARLYVANYENAKILFCQPGFGCLNGNIYANGIPQGKGADMWDVDDPLTRTSCYANATVQGVCNPINWRMRGRDRTNERLRLDAWFWRIIFLSAVVCGRNLRDERIWCRNTLSTLVEQFRGSGICHRTPSHLYLDLFNPLRFYIHTSVRRIVRQVG